MQGRGFTNALMVMILFIFACTDLQADVLEFSPVMDTTLYEDASGRLGNGSGQYLFIGRTWDENGVDKLLRRAVLKFDLDSLPRGSTINSASFSITIDQVPPTATSAIVSLHSLSRNWGEGASNAPGAEGRGTTAQVNDATWLHTFYATGLWNTPGGDFAVEVLASETISSSPQGVTFTSLQLMADVQRWVDDPASNHGWVLLGDEVFIQNARRILSREYSGPGGPLLTLDVSPPPPVDVPALTTTGLLILVLLLLLLSRFFLPWYAKRFAVQH